MGREEGVHRGGEDVAVDGAHLDGLLVLDDDVLQQVLVLVVQLDDAPAQNLFQRHLVGF